MLRDSYDPLIKNAEPSVITGRKWKEKIAVENAESALKMKEIIGTVANGRAGLGLYRQYWWSKESTINIRKIVSEEIHHLEEVTRIVTGVGQKKQGPWNKWESGKDRVVTWGDLKHMESQKLSFLIVDMKVGLTAALDKRGFVCVWRAGQWFDTMKRKEKKRKILTAVSIIHLQPIKGKKRGGARPEFL